MRKLGTVQTEIIIFLYDYCSIERNYNENEGYTSTIYLTNDMYSKNLH